MVPHTLPKAVYKLEIKKFQQFSSGIQIFSRCRMLDGTSYKNTSQVKSSKTWPYRNEKLLMSNLWLWPLVQLLSLIGQNKWLVLISIHHHPLQIGFCFICHSDNNFWVNLKFSWFQLGIKIVPLTNVEGNKDFITTTIFWNITLFEV